MVGEVGLPAVVPLRIDVGRRQPVVLDFVRGEIEIEVKPARRAPLCPGEDDFVVVVGGLARLLRILVVDAAVDAQEFRPRQKLLEPVEDQRILALAGPVSRRGAPLYVRSSPGCGAPGVASAGSSSASRRRRGGRGATSPHSGTGRCGR